MSDNNSSSKLDFDNNPDNLFTNLFVLELANNHWGSVERGKEIIRQHGKMVADTGVKAAVKFQFRDVDTFVHDAFKPQENIEKEGEVVEAPGSSSRYIKKTIATKLTPKEFSELLDEVRAHNMLTMATPFDEKSVDWCGDLDIDIVKIASQDAKSWVLVERIAKLGKPTIISNGGTDIADLDRVVKLFEEKKVPLAINHCVSMYPSEDNELELNQVDYMVKRYPDHVIGYSTHEYGDWHSSVQITYAKGARTWERHVDIEDAEGTPVSKYCSLPHQARIWFEAFNKAVEMSGSGGEQFRVISQKEIDYVQSVSRGAYALRDLAAGETISKETVGTDFEFVIPLQGNQLSSRDLDTEITITKAVKAGDPITFGEIKESSNVVATGWNDGEVRMAGIDALVRTAWLAAIFGLVVVADFLPAGLWTLIASGAIALVVGALMTGYHRYEYIPSTLATAGSIVHGILYGGVLIAAMLTLYFGAPLYVPFVALAATTVATALVSRLGNLFSSRLPHYLLGLALLGAAVAIIGRTGDFSAPWFYAVLAMIVLTFLEQVSIRTTGTGVLLPWVHLLWNGVGMLLFALVVTLFVVPAPLGLIVLLETPTKVAFLAALIGGLYVLSVWTRILMRRTVGTFMHKRIVGVGVLAIAGMLVSGIVAVPALVGVLLAASLAFGDRSKH